MFFEKGPKRGGGSFPIQKITLQIFLVSKLYILVVNFGKNVQKGGEGVISNPKNFIANLRKLTHIYELSQKKAQCNFQKWGGGGGQRPFGSFPKKHPFWGIQSPLRWSRRIAISYMLGFRIYWLLYTHLITLKNNYFGKWCKTMTRGNKVHLLKQPVRHLFNGLLEGESVTENV